MNKPKLLFLHQGAELYGSDKVFAQVIQAASELVDVIVVLSSDGPLKEKISPWCRSIYIMELGVLRRKHYNVKGIFTVLYYFIRALWFLSKLVIKENVKGVYTNTIGILCSPLVAVLLRKKHFWHIHEIITQPTFLSFFFSWIVTHIPGVVICNSNATYSNLSTASPKKWVRFVVIHNSTKLKVITDVSTRTKVCNEFHLNENDVFVAVVGRIHFRKGQDYFLRAAKLVIEKYGRLNVRFGIIGSVYDPKHDDQLSKLYYLVNQLGITNYVRFIDYYENIEELYSAIDIVVVPSQFPESFGLVTVEAMMSKKPVIATALGGSLEIVQDGITGFLVPVNDPVVFAQKIVQLVDSSELRKQMGEAGFIRASQQFNEERFVSEIQKVINTVNNIEK